MTTLEGLMMTSLFVYVKCFIRPIQLILPTASILLGLMPDDHAGCEGRDSPRKQKNVRGSVTLPSEGSTHTPIPPKFDR